MSIKNAVKQQCPICSSAMLRLFSAKVLSQYDVDYFRCTDCNLIQTERPFWLDAAYDAAISDLDIGLVQRNINLSEKVGLIIDRYFDGRQRFLDYAGGYGLFVRLMRDIGFDFYHYDTYCQNIFAKYFSLTDLEDVSRTFELITALELFEHIYDPVTFIEKMFGFSDSILFTTELAPDLIGSVDDWWYFVPETGQHITFYSYRSLVALAQKLKCHLFTDKSNLHLITRNNTLKIDLYQNSKRSKIVKMAMNAIALLRRSPRPIRNRSVSVWQDYHRIRTLLNS